MASVVLQKVPVAGLRSTRWRKKVPIGGDGSGTSDRVAA